MLFAVLYKSELQCLVGHGLSAILLALSTTEQGFLCPKLFLVNI